MPTITTKDGTQSYYKDWGSRKPVVFSHGWPLSADVWEDQMFFLASRGYRCIVHDRCDHSATGRRKTVSSSAARRSRLSALMLFGVLALMLSGSSAPAFAADAELVQPDSLIADGSLPKAQLDQHVLAARRYSTFWSTGDEALARAALAPDFVDRTLPAGRPQGLAGPLAASKLMRAAIPDMRCEIEQMIVTDNRVVVHLRFRGHFTGRFMQTQGQGQAIDFIATDIYRIADGRIAENWHIEDNLTLMQQLGLVAK